MKLENLSMPPYNTSLMGVVKGAADYFGMNVSPAALFGLSGHAFLANVHRELCPSGPYVWKRGGFFSLLRNIGLSIVELGFYDSSSSLEARTAVEAQIREHIDAHNPCGVVNMDYQLITGYDQEGLIMAQPWGKEVDTTPGRLTYGSWAEFGGEMHVDFFAIERCDRVDDQTALREAFGCAVKLYDHPESYTEEQYGVGPLAYENWMHAVRSGSGSTHGAWWNGMVWSECRDMAAAFFRELSGHGTTGDHSASASLADTARELATLYGAVAENLRGAAERELKAEDKIDLLVKARDAELEAVQLIREILPSV